MDNQVYDPRNYYTPRQNQQENSNIDLVIRKTGIITSNNYTI